MGVAEIEGGLLQPGVIRITPKDLTEGADGIRPVFDVGQETSECELGLAKSDRIGKGPLGKTTHDRFKPSTCLLVSA